MNPEENQANMSPEDAKAALGLSTRLSEQMLASDVQQQPQNASQESQEGSTEEMPKESDNTAPEDKTAELEGKLAQGIDDLRQEMHAMNKDTLSSIKEMINQALNESENWHLKKD